MAYKTSNLEGLISSLRVQIGDTAATPTYSDEMLHSILRDAVQALMRRWHGKYYVDVEGVVYRNPSCTFNFSSPPVIQGEDIRPIVLQASIMIKQGQKFANSGDVVSWKDDEISYSNLESGRLLSSSLTEDISELNTLLPPAGLARPQASRLYPRPMDYEK